MIFKKSTAGWSHEEWEADRRARQTIGGSDAGAVLGLNPYKSAYSLWAEKTGKVVPEDISDKEAVRLGNDLEEYVAQRWTEATGKKVRRDNNVWINNEFGFAHANIDRMVVGEKALLECKTTSSWDVLSQCREGKFPDTWLCQVTHYLMVTGYTTAYLAVLCFGHGFYHFSIDRDEADVAALAAAEADFYKHIVRETPPEIDGSEATLEAIKAIHGDSCPGSTVDLTPVGHLLQMYTQLGHQIDDLTAQQAACKAKVMDYMGPAEAGRCDGYSVSYKPQSRSTFDRKAYEKDHGAIDARYFKASESRPFKITVKE